MCALKVKTFVNYKSENCHYTLTYSSFPNKQETTAKVMASHIHETSQEKRFYFYVTSE